MAALYTREPQRNHNPSRGGGGGSLAASLSKAFLEWITRNIPADEVLVGKFFYFSTKFLEQSQFVLFQSKEEHTCTPIVTLFPSSLSKLLV